MDRPMSARLHFGHLFQYLHCSLFAERRIKKPRCIVQGMAAIFNNSRFWRLQISIDHNARGRFHSFCGGMGWAFLKKIYQRICCRNLSIHIHITDLPEILQIYVDSIDWTRHRRSNIRTIYVENTASVPEQYIAPAAAIQSTVYSQTATTRTFKT